MQNKPTEQDNVASLHKEADRGNASAQFELGFCFYLGDGVKQERAEPASWLHEAAEQ